MTEWQTKTRSTHLPNKSKEKYLSFLNASQKIVHTKIHPIHFNHIERTRSQSQAIQSEIYVTPTSRVFLQDMNPIKINLNSKVTLQWSYTKFWHNEGKDLEEKKKKKKKYSREDGSPNRIFLIRTGPINKRLSCAINLTFLSATKKKASISKQKPKFLKYLNERIEELK